MARYKPYNLRPGNLIAVSYADQIVTGSFEYALNEIIEEHLDLTASSTTTAMTRRGGWRTTRRCCSRSWVVDHLAKQEGK